jgi:hypothetical protein
MAKSDDEYTPKEAAKRRDAITRAMIATPPKPHVTIAERRGDSVKAKSRAKNGKVRKFSKNKGR